MRPLTRRKSITPLDQQIDPLTGKLAVEKDMIPHHQLGRDGRFGKQVNPIKRVEDARVARREKLAGKRESSLRYPVNTDEETKTRNASIKETNCNCHCLGNVFFLPCFLFLRGRHRQPP